LYLQTLVGGDGFFKVASGYVGDPGFMALAPDGHTMLLGAGQPGQLYLFDTRAPKDYRPGDEVATVPHYYGAFLNPQLVLLDKATDDFSTSELVIVDLSVPSPVPKRVMLKPPLTDLVGYQYGVSACLATSASRTSVYVMGLIYDGWTLVSSQLKRIAVSDLINAYNSKAVLDWDADAVAIGAPNAFNSGGPAGVAPNGDLLIGGFGGVQRVDPVSAIVVDTCDPAGPFEYYGVAYNPYTDVVMPIVADPVDWSMDVVYAPTSAFGALPAAGPCALAVLMGFIILVAFRRRRRVDTW